MERKVLNNHKIVTREHYIRHNNFIKPLFTFYILYYIFYFRLIFSVKPLTVKIYNPQSPLVADRRYEISCESTGSRPNAIITWYKGKRQLRRTRVSLVFPLQNFLFFLLFCPGRFYS